MPLAAVCGGPSSGGVSVSIVKEIGVGAILTDEIGVEFALLGKFRARARYRPVYLRNDSELSPIAVQGEMAITHGGVEVAAQLALGADPSSAAAQALDLLALTLVVRNHHRSDGSALDLHLDFPKGLSRALCMEALDELATPAAKTRNLTVFVSGTDVEDIEISDMLREEGYRLGMAADLNDPMLAEAISAAKPDVVRIDGEWLAKAAQSAALAALLAQFVLSCRDSGTRTMLTGVDDRVRLMAALGTGAELLAGEALGRALLAGAVMDLSPVSAIGLPTSNVLPFARRSG